MIESIVLAIMASAGVVIELYPGILGLVYLLASIVLSINLYVFTYGRASRVFNAIVFVAFTPMFLKVLASIGLVYPWILDVTDLFILIVLLALNIENEVLSGLYKTHIPILVLASVILGVWLDLTNPLSLALVPIIDTILAVAYIREPDTGSLILATLLYIIIYSGFAPGASILFYSYSYIVYMLKIFPTPRRKKMSEALLATDIILKPLIYRYGGLL
ncbi:hypothetical protein ACSU1N_03585 [Thermogladius sp. 4427co]|uniref:hypothetical protein n=1 Tax=Thermogladius sp. 4427co TaxID=3450718 RepID=UPI003F78B256